MAVPAVPTSTTSLSKKDRTIAAMRRTGARIRADRKNVTGRAIGAGSAILLADLLVDYAKGRIDDGEAEPIPLIQGVNPVFIGGVGAALAGVLGVSGDVRVDSALAYGGVAAVVVARAIERLTAPPEVDEDAA